MGWKRRNEKWEDETQYSERISGMICAWAVITQSKLGASSEFEHPYPISNSWKFLARQMNKDPKLLQNSDYAAVAGWWDISAKRFLDVYGKQGAKLLKLAWDQWTAISSDHKYPAAARLRLLGEDWAQKGVIVVKWKQMSA
jgi:nucleoporin GLE1